MNGVMRLVGFAGLAVGLARAGGQVTVERINVTPKGEQSAGGVAWPEVSADGRYVAFASRADDLVPGDINGAWDVFVRDLEAGETRRVSVSSGGAEANAASGVEQEFGSRGLAMSSDGRYIAFISAATNLKNGEMEVDLERDVFVHDRVARTTVKVPNMTGARDVYISPSGRYVFSYNGRGWEWDATTGMTVLLGDISGRLRSRDGGIVGVTRTEGCIEVGPVDSFQFMLGPVCLATTDAIISLRDMSDDGLHVLSKIRYVLAGKLFESCVYGPLPPPSVEAPCIVGYDGGPAGDIVPAMSPSGYFFAHVDVGEGRGVHVFERDPAGGHWTVLSNGYDGMPLDGVVRDVDIADNALMVFTSAATNLVVGDTNGEIDLFAARGMAPTREVDVEISVLLDASSAVSEEEYTRAVNALRAAVADPTVFPRNGRAAVRFGLFDDRVDTRIAWSAPECPCEAAGLSAQLTEGMAMARGNLTDGACLRSVLQDEPPAFDFNRYYGGRKVLLLVGASEDVCATVEELAAARDRAFTWVDEIDAVAMDDSGAVAAFYESLVAGPAGSGFVLQGQSDYSDAGEKIREALRSIANRAGTTCAGDMDGDGVVDFVDYLDFLTRFSDGDCAADLNEDCAVDFTDYLMFLEQYGRGC